jgi:hypothetical protein
MSPRAGGTGTVRDLASSVPAIAARPLSGPHLVRILRTSRTQPYGSGPDGDPTGGKAASPPGPPLPQPPPDTGPNLRPLLQ